MSSRIVPSLPRTPAVSFATELVLPSTPKLPLLVTPKTPVPVPLPPNTPNSVALLATRALALFVEKLAASPAGSVDVFCT